MASGTGRMADGPHQPYAISHQPLAMAASAQPLIDLRPIDHVPPRVDVVRPAILVLQVVGVLPDVDAEDRVLAVHQRTVLVRGALDGELVAAADHPRPAAAEPARRGLLHFLFQLVEAAER